MNQTLWQQALDFLSAQFDPDGFYNPFEDRVRVLRAGKALHSPDGHHPMTFVHPYRSVPPPGMTPVAPDDPAVLAVMARFADSPSVNEVLESQPAPALRAALTHALSTAPALSPWSHRAATALLARIDREETASTTPLSSWVSPWLAKASKPKTKKVPAPAVAEFTEAFHGAIRSIAPDAVKDQELLARWNTYHLFEELARMSDPLAYATWETIEPNQWLQIGTMATRFGLRGLTRTLEWVTLNDELSALADFESPRVAPVMAALHGKPAWAPTTRAWFERFPEAATVGLVPDTLAKKAKTVEQAVTSLRFIQRVRPDEFARGLQRYPDEVRHIVERLVEVAVELPAKKPSLPLWANPKRFSPLVGRDGASGLHGEALGEVMALLKVTPLTGGPWLDALRSHFTEASLTQLAKELLTVWFAVDAPPKERWASQAAAHFPSTELADLLGQTAAELAPKGLSARAQELVEVLAAMKTRVGLKWVHTLSRKVRSKAFRARAELIFQTAAESMGMSELELAERLVPDYGLTPEGALPVSPVIRLVVEGTKATFVNEQGAAVKTWPELDAESDLPELKKKGAALVREVAARLERRMAEGRHMSPEHFTEVYLQNGVTRQIANQVLWGLYVDQALRTAFMLTDFAGVTPIAGSTVGVVHPIEITQSERLKWPLVKQPFEQLERRVNAFKTVDDFEKALAGYEGREVPSGALLGLEKRQWVRGDVQDGGCYWTYAKAVGGASLTLQFSPGIYIGNPAEHPRQRIDSVVTRLTGTPSPLVLSEFEHDLHEALS